MNQYHYIDDLGNISDALPLEALHKINLPPATKVLLEGSNKWITLGDVSQGGPVVFPVPPLARPSPPTPPPPTSQSVGATAAEPDISTVPRPSAFYPTFYLGLFLGVFGVHRFYLAKIGTGILQLVTFGGLGVWWLVDMITILLGKFRDKKGAVIPNVNPKVSWSVFAVVVIIGLATRSGDSALSSSSAGKCLKNGCENMGQGWRYSTGGEKTILGTQYGCLRTTETGGYCSRQHCSDDH
jgi:TM2 domain-containing membrane protein YozV